MIYGGGGSGSGSGSGSGKNRTQKRSVVSDVSGSIFAANFRATVEKAHSLQNYLDTKAEEAYARPWHKLERGLRLNRLRQFTEEEAKKLQLSAQDKQNLFILLTKSLDKKLLNSKTAVIYDIDKQCITEIKGLVMHRNSEGQVLFNLLEKKNAVTFRRKPTAQATVPTAAAETT